MMPKRRNLSVEKRSAVVILSREGYSGLYIAVRNILRKKEKTGTVADKPRQADQGSQVSVKIGP